MSSPAIVTADCRAAMPGYGPFDLIVADPPYGDTALAWDRRVEGWMAVARACLKPTGSIWVFGSMRSFLALGIPPGLRYAQDLVWEKHNGTGFAADRLKRVHEHACQFYRSDAPWRDVFNEVQRRAREGPEKTGVQRRQLAHTGAIGPSAYKDDGTRIQRSVIKMPSVRHVGRHATEKPVLLLEILIRSSCPPRGLVGDFFAGSGAAGEAAHNAGRAYVGCEIDPLTAAIARERLAAL